MIFKDHIRQKNGVFLASKPTNDFSDAYIKVRQNEGRIYSDDELTGLPQIATNHRHADEWKLRQKSARRFADYLEKNKQDALLLEIGCGNGWFTRWCAKHVKTAVGIDVNHQELEQAARVFESNNIHFAYWNIFSDNPFNAKFDVIVLNAVIQYFPNFEKLLSCLKKHLSPGGEIHILDSPFYQANAVDLAKQRTQAYYQKAGVPEMAEHYFHHSIDAISDFEVLYQPSQNKLKRLIKGKDMPFGWYKKVMLRF